MRLCPICDTEYPNDHLACPNDGAKLLARNDWDPGTIIKGKYRIIALIGQGGMGTVYKAEHIALQETRALKVMASSLASDQQFVRRFRQEAQVARRLRHPNIVHVDDLDQADDASLFIVMDYIEGISVSQLIRDTAGPLPVERTLTIVRGVASALATAHEQGVIHRDIKPDNILLTRDVQGKEIPKVLDFGIVAMKESSATLSTRLLLTPPYAPPEQWRGMKSSELDGRADLYALGVTWYEMLTGHLPFQAQNTEAWMRAHLDEMPQPPTKWHPPLENYPELNVVVMKLLSKDREQRTQNAQELLQQINQLEAEIRSKENPRAQRQKTLIEIPIPHAKSRERTPTVVENPQRQATLIEPVSQQDPAAEQSAEAIPTGDQKNEPVVHKPRRRFIKIILGITAAVIVAAIVTAVIIFSPPVSDLTGHPQFISSLAFSPNGKLIASGGMSDTVLWNVATRREVLSHSQRNVQSLAFTPDGKMLASAGEDTVELWDTTTGNQVQTFAGHTDRILSLAISSDGSLMITGSADKTVKLWDLATGQETQSITTPDAVNSVAFSPDGKSLAYAASGNLLYRDVSPAHKSPTLLQFSLFFHTSKGLGSYIRAIAFSPDGKLIAGISGERFIKLSSTANDEISLWDRATGHLTTTLTGHPGTIKCMAFSPDGKLLASGSSDHAVRLWNVATGSEIKTFTGHEYPINSVAFSPDGKLLASASDDQIVKFWNIE